MGCPRPGPSLRAKRSNPSGREGRLDCFVAIAPLRKRFAFVAGNDDASNTPKNQKAGSRPAAFLKCRLPCWEPGRSEAPPGLVGYFFFDFLAFLAFFAFFAFLAIASSFGLMGGNATRGMLGGGPTSQHPQLRSQQIRRPLPRTVTQASSRYPQLLCVLTRFRRRDTLGGGESSRASRIMAPPTPAREG